MERGLKRPALSRLPWLWGGGGLFLGLARLSFNTVETSLCVDGALAPYSELPLESGTVFRTPLSSWLSLVPGCWWSFPKVT